MRNICPHRIITNYKDSDFYNRQHIKYSLAILLNGQSYVLLHYVSIVNNHTLDTSN